MKMLVLVSLSLFLFSCSSTEKRESFGEYVDNSAISTKVKSKLLSNSKVSGTAIDVESFKGTVILAGFVSSEEEKELAIELAKKVNGVKNVKEALVVKSELSE